MVKGFRKIVRILRREQGEIALFMLKSADTDIADYWNVIVSTPDYDSLTTKKALKHLVSILRSNLSKDVFRRILRVTVLKTDDPFTREINRAFNVKNSEEYIHLSVVSGIYIENAIIFESVSVPSAGKIRHKKKHSQNKMADVR
ncbi:Uncharacterized protein dnm_039300 [Desulfonema magnum]|uniref:Uncharacterized protein n=1 Tax=Desulfonema magnum TaxID=45655 RepID=A0A975BLX9_9BACT|nr:Uncharacterized protein dnm_039300 [Desulfonema magnum]